MATMQQANKVAHKVRSMPEFAGLKITSVGICPTATNCKAAVYFSNAKSLKQLPQTIDGVEMKYVFGFNISPLGILKRKRPR